MTTERKFDRLVQFDERSRAFPIRALLPTVVKPRSYTWGLSIQLDQGPDGACVGFGISHEAAARPVSILGITNDTAFKLYKRAQDLDEFEGSDYEGTSVLGGVKAAQELNWYPEYRWCFSLEDLYLTVGHHGPVILGVEWREDMMNTDAKGFIHATGDVVGGHCICCRGVNVKQKYFLLRNSWGTGFGINGDCKVSFDDMDALLHQSGEACVPVKRAMGRPATAGQ